MTRPSNHTSWLVQLRKNAWLFLVAHLLIAGPARANPIIDGFITLETVYVTAPAGSFANIHDESSTASYLAVVASPYFAHVRFPVETYWDYLEHVAAVKVNPATTPDVRCNMNATQQTKTTTSQADTTNRFLAAQQLFTAIRAVDNGASARALLRDSASYFYNGAKQFTFRVTYADGGTEAWIVASVLTSALVNEGNVPNSLVQGDGTVKNCPATSGG